MIDISRKFSACPNCGNKCKVHSLGDRHVVDLNRIIKYKISKHYCIDCRKYFSTQPDTASKFRRYSNRVIYEVVNLCDKFDPESIRDIMIKKYDIKIARSTIDEWIIGANKISRSKVDRKLKFMKNDRIRND